MKNSCIKRTESSETTRVVCLHEKKSFSTVNTKVSKKNLKCKIHCYYFIAGLLDGAGSVCVSKGKGKGKEKENSIRCEITVNEKKNNLLTILKKNFHGNIKLCTNAKSYRWRLQHINKMKLFISAMNGKFLLHTHKNVLQKMCKL